MPERESDHLTPATRLLEKRREMAEVEQALATQKEVSGLNFQMELTSKSDHGCIVCNLPIAIQEFQMKMETLQQRREELERKEENLKESLLKFDKFLKVRG